MRRIFLLVVITLIWLGSGLAFADSFWKLYVVDATDRAGTFNSLALDAEGHPHISYWDYYSGDLKYTGWLGSGRVMGAVDSEGKVGQSTSLALDSGGYPHISYYDNTNQNLKYKQQNPR